MTNVEVNGMLFEHQLLGFLQVSEVFALHGKAYDHRSFFPADGKGDSNRER